MKKNKERKANTTLDSKKNRQWDILVSAGKTYEICSEFETDKMFSGVCYVVKTDIGTFQGFDSGYFDEIK